MENDLSDVKVGGSLLIDDDGSDDYGSVKANEETILFKLLCIGVNIMGIEMKIKKELKKGIPNQNQDKLTVWRLQLKYAIKSFAKMTGKLA